MIHISLAFIAVSFHRVSEQELFDHLWQIETQHMGLFGNRGKTQQVTQKPLLLNTQFESTPTT
jgi:hypothetical protein